jgi:RecB family exonuclease
VPLPCDAPAPGGQDALRRQAACPFQSFAHHRLRAVELEVAGRGLSAAERGNLVHWTLEGLWSVDTDEFPHLGSLEDLREAAAGGLLRPRVEVHAARAMARLNAADDSQWQRNYLTAERKRLVDLVLRWLKHEGRRESFRVLSAEKQEQVRVGPLTLNVRADRIDQVAGGTLLIDYKTGSASRPASWEGPRPEEPQLPLYAGFVAPDDLVGAVFGKVLPEKECFAGLVQDAGLNLMKDSKLNPLTPEIRQQWRIDLEALAASFAQGEAQVDPRDGQETCRYCPLTALCRVAETGARNLGEDAGDTAAEDTGVPAP